MILWIIIVIFMLLNAYMMIEMYSFKTSICIQITFSILQICPVLVNLSIPTLDKGDKNILCGCAMFLYLFLKFLRMNKENIEPNIFDIFELLWFSVLPFCGVILQVLFLIVIIALSYFLAYLNFYKKNDFIKTIILCSEEFAVCIVCIVFDKDVFTIYSIVMFCEVVFGTINKKVFEYVDIFYSDKCIWALDIDW